MVFFTTQGGSATLIGMPSRKYSPPPPPVPKEFSSVSEVDGGIRKLTNCLEEVRSLEASQVRYDDQQVNNAESSIQGTILEVFGAESPEYGDHQAHRIAHGPLHVGDDDADRQRRFAEGILKTATLLEGLTKRLKTKRHDLVQSQAAQRYPDLTPRQAGLLAAIVEHVGEGGFLVSFTKDENGRHVLPLDKDQSLPPDLFPSFDPTDLAGLEKQGYLTVERRAPSDFRCAVTAKALDPTLSFSPDNRRSGSGAARSRVFLVHGHNEGAREGVARFLERLDLEVTVLGEQANEGRTLAEKLEHYADAAFAVVLLTCDDVGRLRTQPSDKDKPRARQNVILELGFFIATLGRKHVCPVCEADLEIPSDIHGLGYVKLDTDGAWKFSLAKELKAAGLLVDLNRVFDR